MGPLWRALSPLGRANKFGAASAATLFNDSFDTDGAISAGARTADPGPGTAAIVDSTAVWSSVSGGILTPSKGFTVRPEPDYQSEAFSYQSGLAAIFRFAKDNRGGSLVENWIYAGWAAPGTDGNFYESAMMVLRQDSYYTFQQGVYSFDAGLRVATGIADYPTELEYQTVAIVMSDAPPNDPYSLTVEGGYLPGGFYFFFNGKLRHFTASGIIGTWDTDNMRARLTHWYSGIAPRSAALVDYVRVRDLGATFSNGSFATVDERPPAWDTPYTASADGIYQFIFTSVAAPTGKCEMRFRIQDNDNYWTAYFSIAENKYCVDSVAAGVPTRRYTGEDATGAGTWFPDGYQNGYRIRTDGTQVIFYSYSYGYVYSETIITLDHCTSATGIKIVQDNTDYTPQSLVCYPISSATYDVFDEV